MSEKHIFDEEWCTRLTAIGGLLDYEWLQKFVHISTREKGRFLQNQVENPRIKCDFEGDIMESITALKSLEVDIKSREQNTIVRDLYLDKIKKQIYREEMYVHSTEGDDLSFYKKSAKIYGVPKKKFFAYAVKRTIAVIESSQKADLKPAKRLLKTLKHIDTSRITIDADVLPPPINDGEALSAAEVERHFTETLEYYKLTGWKVVISQNRPRFSISVNDKVVYIPEDSALSVRRIPLTETRVKAIAEHEIGVHVRRSFNGSRQPLKLLGVGLSGYLLGEEGLATYVQQQTEGAEDYYGIDRYLAAGLAAGLDGEVRDFRSIFSIMCDYYTVMQSGEDESVNMAFNAAWEVCIRLFRGTTGATPGAIFTRDINYLEGNIATWDFIIDHPERYQYLFIGKFNHCNKIHIESLQELKILPQW